MLSKTDIEKLKALGFDADKLVEAAKADAEVPIIIPEVFTQAQLEEAKTNAKRGHEQAYPEIWGKQMNTEHELGLSVTDAKDHKKVMEAMKAKGVKDANIPANEKVKELEASLKKLQEETVPQYESKAKEWESKYNERITNDKYDALIPENANKFLTREEHRNRIKSIYEINEDGSLKDKATGNIVKDALEKPLQAKDVIAKTYKETEGWLQPEGGGKQFHHSTSGGGAGAGGKRPFDHDAAWETLKGKYNMNSLSEREMAQNEYTAMQANATV